MAVSLSALESLPLDILRVQIPLCLSLPDLPRLFQTNHLFHHLSQEPYLWNLLIQRDYHQEYPGKNFKYVYRILWETQERVIRDSTVPFTDSDIQEILIRERILEPYITFISSILVLDCMMDDYIDVFSCYQLDSETVLYVSYLGDKIALRIMKKSFLYDVEFLFYPRQDPSLINQGIQEIIESYLNNKQVSCPFLIEQLKLQNQSTRTLRYKEQLQIVTIYENTQTLESLNIYHFAS